MSSKIIRFEGIIPPYMMGEILKRNPKLRKHLGSSIATSHDLREQRSASGRIILPNITGDAQREIWDAKDGEERPGVKVRSENDPDTGDHDTDAAFAFTGNVRDYYREVHSRNSIDGAGMDMVSIVHFKQKFNNAFWDGQVMTYGRGDQIIFRNFVLLDICGHEITHGVTQFEAAMRYFGQSGALNESISDVFGKLIEMYASKTPVKDFNWVIGNGIFMPGISGRGIRDMKEPGTAYQNEKMGKDPQPAHMDHYLKLTKDKGGVHLNSGIPNRAFALFATDVGGFAWDKSAQVWFAARAEAGSNPCFASFAFHTIHACSALGFSSETDKLVAAWKAVGVTPDENAVDDLTPAPVVPPSQAGGSIDDDEDDGHSH